MTVNLKCFNHRVVCTIPAYVYLPKCMLSKRITQQQHKLHQQRQRRINQIMSWDDSSSKRVAKQSGLWQLIKRIYKKFKRKIVNEINK